MVGDFETFKVSETKKRTIENSKKTKVDGNLRLGPLELRAGSDTSSSFQSARGSSPHINLTPSSVPVRAPKHNARLPVGTENGWLNVSQRSVQLGARKALAEYFTMSDDLVTAAASYMPVFRCDGYGRIGVVFGKRSRVFLREGARAQH